MRRERKIALGSHPVRLATPFTLKCLECGEFIPRNKRHNATKETAIGKEYLGIESYRFYIKCTGCKKLMTILTDPQHGCYTAESGCRRIEEGEEAKTREAEVEESSANRLRRESEMMDEIELLKMQMKSVNSSRTGRPSSPTL
jgi:hypothetical protein